ncbi:hypothetical protein ABQ397_00680 [Serratia fonticola]|uniref:hypothetical protein n=1 Tax=Serratia TaxID=613 RepID=UPI00102293CA|nr:hypothetical protein [Serratia liquefaciens]RYM67758.1 hypothetical protein BSQ99_23095 [Serratia liquefaciens]
MNIQHKHSGHIIIINGHSFKANESGMWNLTEIWKVLGLTRSKEPGRWNNKESKMLRDRNEISVLKVGKVSQMVATKFATLQYAGWVSLEFSMMVYAAFESILEMPEVATVVANKMVELGYQKEAELLERHTNADRDYAHAEMKRWRDTTTNKSRCSAVLAGHISLQTAVSQGLKGVWLERCRAGLEAMGDY